MSYSRTPSSLSACCSGCAAGASTCGDDGLGAVQPPPAPRPGEGVYSYMARVAEHFQTELKIATHMKEYDAKVAAADAAAKAATAAAAVGFAVPPGAQEKVARDLGMPMTTKLIIGGVAALALFMLMRRK